MHPFGGRNPLLEGASVAIVFQACARRIGPNRALVSSVLQRQTQTLPQQLIELGIGIYRDDPLAGVKFWNELLLKKIRCALRRDHRARLEVAFGKGLTF